jgi:putative ABC transport system permease protein
MYIFINSLKNIGRNKGRNILIGIIILALITVSIVSLSIHNTTGSIIDDYRTRFGSEVTIAFDMARLMQGMDGGMMVMPQRNVTTATQYMEFAKSRFVRDYNITATSTAAADGIKAVGEDDMTAGGGAQIFGGTTIVGQDNVMETGVASNVMLLGNEFDEFNTGFRQLQDGGRMPQYKNEALISIDLAELNGLEVGDRITVSVSVIRLDGDIPNMTDESIELSITGIFVDATEADPHGFPIPFLNRRNEILTTVETITDAFGDSLSVMVDATFYLHDPSMLYDFEAELRTLGLDEHYTVSVDEAGFNSVVGPVEGLRNVSLTFMFIVLAFGAVLLVLLSSIAVRERKYEIGVLRAMGMKKKKVAFGFWAEMMMITLLCLIIGLGAGTVLAQPISDTLLAGQIEIARETAAQTAPAGQGGITIIGGTTASTQPAHVPLETIDISVGINTVLQIAAIALLLATLASVVSIAKVTKYEPIKILMERN